MCTWLTVLGTIHHWHQGQRSLKQLSELYPQQDETQERKPRLDYILSPVQSRISYLSYDGTCDG